MRNIDLRGSLAALAGGAAWVEIGAITAIDDDDDTGHRITVEVGAQPLSCRPFYLGANAGAGDFARFVVGSEALVLLPGGDPNAAVAIVGGANREAKPPDDFAHDRRIIVDPGGTSIRETADEATQRVVVQEFLADLSTMLGDANTAITAAATAMTTLSGAAVGPLAALAPGFTSAGTALTNAASALSAMKVKVDASLATPGRPHLSHILQAGVSK